MTRCESSIVVPHTQMMITRGDVESVVYISRDREGVLESERQWQMQTTTATADSLH